MGDVLYNFEGFKREATFVLVYAWECVNYDYTLITRSLTGQTINHNDVNLWKLSTWPAAQQWILQHINCRVYTWAKWTARGHCTEMVKGRKKFPILCRYLCVYIQSLKILAGEYEHSTLCKEIYCGNIQHTTKQGMLDVHAFCVCELLPLHIFLNCMPPALADRLM